MPFVMSTNPVVTVSGSDPIVSAGGSTPIISIQNATVDQKGAVQLEDSTTSTSIIKAATPKSVKDSYDHITTVSGVLQSNIDREEIIQSVSDTLTRKEVRGTQISNYGQGAVDNLQLLPDAEEGMNFVGVCGTAQTDNYFRFQAATNDKIYFNGVAGSDNGYISIASPVVGALIYFSAFQTGPSTYDWDVDVIFGDWLPEKEFRFTVQTAGDVETFSLPLESSGTYDFTVDWGDEGSDDITVYNQAEATHAYASAGTYEIKITGTITGWAFDWGGDCLKLYEIKAWGPLNLGNYGYYFAGCENLTVTATDILDLTGTTSLISAFDSCYSLTIIPSMNDWNVSLITSFAWMFFGDSSFNQPLNKWDLSSAMYVFGMFRGASSFNQDISSWKTSSILQMMYMFYEATSFNQDISSYDITSVTDMSEMFTSVTLSTANYDTLLIGWEAQAVQDSISFHGGDSKYSAGAAATARQALIDDHNWTIQDGGQEAQYYTTTELDDGQLDIRYYTESEVDGLITTISGKLDDHNEMNNLDYSSSGHTGFQPAGDYLTDTEFTTYSGTLQTQIDDKSDVGHTHDDRYYTEIELDNGQLDIRYYTESEVDTISGSLQIDIDNKIVNADAIKWAIVFGGM